MKILVCFCLLVILKLSLQNEENPNSNQIQNLTTSSENSTVLDATSPNPSELNQEENVKQNITENSQNVGDKGIIHKYPILSALHCVVPHKILKPIAHHLHHLTHHHHHKPFFGLWRNATGENGVATNTTSEVNEVNEIQEQEPLNETAGAV